MSALVMALATGMAVGSGPEPVAVEVADVLGLDGTWEGSWKSHDQEFRASLRNGELRLKTATGDLSYPWTFEDEGQGKLRIRSGGQKAGLGIYKREGGRLFLCIRAEGDGRPTFFCVAEGQPLLTLRQVRPRK